MMNRTRSMLTGAAVASLLVLPSLAAPSKPPVPAAPPAAPLPPPPPVSMVPPPGTPAGVWVKRPTRNFDANSVKLNDLVGTLVINVKASGPMTLDVAGYKERVDALEVSQDGKKLVIQGAEVNDVWDWKHWFDFSEHDHSRRDNLVVVVGVPKGADVKVDGLVGNANIGDTYGHLKFEAAASNAKVGRVGPAEISLAGTGKVDVVSVNGPLSLDIAGSGNVNTGPVNGPLKADIAGAGDASVGPVAQGMKVDIAGSGDLKVASIHGKASVDIAGSGSVKVGSGEANPLSVDIMGSGDFDFGGVAVDPRISALGSGRVKLKSYRGKISADGMVTVHVGDKQITVGDDDNDDHGGGNRDDDDDDKDN